jgi:hypothetical protein
VSRVTESPESKQMRAALVAIRAKLERMRLEGQDSMQRLAATRRQADVSAKARDRRSQASP